MGFFDRFFGPPSQNKFAAMVQDRLRRAGDRRACVYDSSQFRLMFAEDGKNAGMLNLRNFYAEYLVLDKAQRAEMWAKVIRTALAHNVAPPEEFEDAKPDLRPIVRTRSYLEHVRLEVEISGETFKPVPHMQVGDHLVACLVYDLPASMMYVTQDQLDQWGITFYEAMEVARQNLAEVPYDVAVIGDCLFTPLGDDSYEAARLLFPGQVQRMAVSGQPVAMAVNTRKVFVTGSDDIAGLALLAAMAEEFGGEPRPLCAVPMRLVDDEWETWMPPEDHPHFAAFKLLKLKYLVGEYADQKAQLDRLHEARGIDHFVATFGANDAPDGAFSYAVWPPVPTLLPEADYLYFVADNPEVRQRAAWSRAQAVLGDRMRPQDVFPPRWLVESFPTADELTAMHAEPF